MNRIRSGPADPTIPAAATVVPGSQLRSTWPPGSRDRCAVASADRCAVSLAVVLLTVACSPGESEPPSSIDYDTGTHLVLLGTGTPNADPDRSGPAVAVVVNGTPYLVDAGPGVVRRAAAARDKGISGLRPSNLGHVFLTHLHSDHTLGLPDLIFTPWVLERDRPVELYGPPGAENMVAHITAAYDADVRVRLDGLEPANPLGYKVNVHEISAGVIYQDDNVVVTAFPVRHGAWDYAFGYRFETADRAIVISGDAVPSQSVVKQCNGCDVLVHEVYSQAGFERRDPVWQRYHASSHTSTVQLAELATQARPGLLVLYHQLYWGATDEELLAEIGAHYDGVVVSGRDLD
ncbi:MAG: MBL fold metallo-hydrolase, partial [Gemmatimonadota bacterium]